jgi:hypothetical protein
MRFTLRAALIAIGILSIVFVAYERQSRDWRMRQRLINEIASFGGSAPTIDENYTVSRIYIEDRITAPLPDRFSVLKSLYCGGSNVTDDDLRHLESAEEILVLSLNETKITDDGLHYLSNIKSLNAIRFDGTSISDAGMNSLSTVHFKLGVDLSGTRVTRTGVDRLKELRPEIYVIHRDLGLDGCE